MTSSLGAAPRERRLLQVRGVVQGVGFRPAVYRVAVEQGLGGFVRNDGGGVTIEIEGERRAVDAFASLLRSRAPVASRIDEILTRNIELRGDRAFRVEASGESQAASTEVPADRAVCDDCVRELFDGRNRRFHYPFITCTNCGPRFTIVRELPYDRARTTMSAFTMCYRCKSEYADPNDRRFHSETNSCHDCGPRLSMAMGEAAVRLRAGEIVAVKGLGGFHLAADAMNELVVKRLRERKGRPEKPFAVMARDLDSASRFVIIDEVAAAVLAGSSRPIVCLPKRRELAPSVAPGLDEIGVMLPYTPIHHLLLAAGPSILVMTSGNLSDEPIAIDDEDAQTRLSRVADAFLLHDREIHARADDSVVRVIASVARPVRRSRGMVPDAIAMPFASAPVLAVGAELKNTVCLTRGRAAYVSAHVGDLSHPQALAFFEELVTGSDAVAVAHDLHPDYRSTRWAMQSSLTRIAVQHHHAHIASCMIDNGRTDRVIGVAFDGTGCGPAGELWGGEFLVCDLDRFERRGHLRAIALPGGEAAIREPWRLAIAALADAGLPLPAADRTRAIGQMVATGLNSPLATSAGRWFDAIAALCGVREEVTFEGQAAMELESIAGAGASPYPFDIAGAEIDLRPMVRAIVSRRESADNVASRFHETLAHAIRAMCVRLRGESGIGAVALSGGCFQNRRLTERTREMLEDERFEVLLHRRVPPNDGGISLGQAAVAAWRLREDGN